MVGPIVRRKGKMLYHRGRGVWSEYSPERDWKRKAKTKMKGWSSKRRSKYRHTAD
ncbi:MAG: hypothetical protein QXT26_08455 [Thermoproteota archaeon]